MTGFYTKRSTELKWAKNAYKLRAACRIFVGRGLKRLNVISPFISLILSADNVLKKTSTEKSIPTKF